MGRDNISYSGACNNESLAGGDCVSRNIKQGCLANVKGLLDEGNQNTLTILIE